MEGGCEMVNGTRLKPEVIDRYTKEGLWKNKTLYDYFKKILKEKPDRIALVDRHHRLTFRDIEMLSNNLARSFRRLGLKKGDVVSFQLPNWYQAAVLNLALVKLDIVINPIIPIYREREVLFILKLSVATT